MISSHLNENISSLDFGLKTNYSQTSVQWKMMFSSRKINLSSGGSKGARRMRAPPPPLILSILCSVWENLAKSHVGAHPGESVPGFGTA